MQAKVDYAPVTHVNAKLLQVFHLLCHAIVYEVVF